MPKYTPDELNKLLFNKVNQAISLHAIGDNKKSAITLASAARILDRWDRLVKNPPVKKEKHIEESVVENDPGRRQREGTDKKVQTETSSESETSGS